MNVIVRKKANINGVVNVPSSKSYAIRALLCAFLCNKQITITNMMMCDDIKYTLLCLKKLSAQYEIDKDKIILKKHNQISFKSKTLNVKGSATLLRLLIPIVLVLYPNVTFKIKCDETLINRPIDGYSDLFKDNNIIFKIKKDYFLLKGEINKSTSIVDASKSSQYVSGLLMALPLLNFDSELVIKNQNGSNDYINLTIHIMKLFGIEISYLTKIEGNKKYTYQNEELECEGDYTSAAFLIAASINTQDLFLKGLNPHSMQGDKRIVDIINAANGKIEFINDELRVYKSKLECLNVDCQDNIDLAPILFALAVFCKKESHFKNIERLKYKESNRLKETLDILKRLNVQYELKENELTIYPKDINISGLFNSTSDHRLVHMLLVMLSMSNKSIEISDAEAISKSYKNLFVDIKKLGFSVKKLNHPKILISIKDENDFALKADGYVLGYEKFSLFSAKNFNYEFIKKHSATKKIFLLLNAMIHQDMVNEFILEAQELAKLNINFIVQDIGAVEVLKQFVDSKRIIFMPYTLICNKYDAKAYMEEKYLAIGVSNEIRIIDVHEISKHTKTFVNIFGYVPMYQSYRKIISLFKEYKNLDLTFDNLTLREDTRDEHYHVLENKYGSVVFRSQIINYLDQLDALMHVKYVYLDQQFIDEKMFKNALNLTNKYYHNHLSKLVLIKKIINSKLPNLDMFKYEDTLVRRTN